MQSFHPSNHRRIEDRIVCYFVPSPNREGAHEAETDCCHFAHGLSPNSCVEPTVDEGDQADAQKVLKIISSDKAKTRIYCQMARLGDQMQQANEKGDPRKFDQLFQRMYELGKKLGPEYVAMIDELGDIDPVSEVGQEISLTLDALDNLCEG
jgi:hypothetical protein